MELVASRTNERGGPWLAAALLRLLSVSAAAQPALEVTVSQATFVKQGQPASAALVKDGFGPGVDGIGLWHGDPVGIRDEAQAGGRSGRSCWARQRRTGHPAGT